jgi:RNA polymerase sigma-70 factor (ECF subfamily)
VNGGSAGFDGFYESHFDRVARALVLAGADRERAYDAAQDAFTKALKRWRTVGVMERPDGWVYVVAMNRLRDVWRSDKRDATTELEVNDPEVGVVTRVSVRDAIATLAPRQRQAVVLRYLVDLPVRDVAAAMGCAEGTAKAALHQALRAMRIELEDDDAV